DSRAESPAVASTVQSAGSRGTTDPLVQSTPPVKQTAPRLGRAVLSQSKAGSSVEVVVSSEEQAGLEHYAAGLQRKGRENSARSAATQGDPALSIRPLEIAAMDLRQLTIEPLEGDEYN